MAAIAEKIVRGGVEGAWPEGRSQNVGKKERNMSLAAGALLVLHGLSRKSTAGLIEAVVGGGLLYRGATGFCAMYDVLGVDTKNDSAAHNGGIRVQRSIMVDRDPQTVYRFWRQLDNLPTFMDHIESVSVLSNTRSHWKAKAPAGTSVEWDAEITEDVPGHHIAWRSLKGATVSNSGAVGFIPAHGGSATEVKVSLRYDPPGGKVSSTLAKILGEEPSVQIAEDLQRLKEVLERPDATERSGGPVTH